MTLAALLHSRRFLRGAALVALYIVLLVVIVLALSRDRHRR